MNIRTMGLRGIACVLLAWGLAGCESPARRSLATGGLYRAARYAVLHADAQELGDLPGRTVVETEVIRRPEVVVTPVAAPPSTAPVMGPGYAPAGGMSAREPVTPGRGYSTFEERWTVDRGGKRVPYRVTFTPDGRGGMTMKVDPEKP